jgi:hypothetical protein
VEPKLKEQNGPYPIASTVTASVDEIVQVAHSPWQHIPISLLVLQVWN